jgi:hypothetical protein
VLGLQSHGGVEVDQSGGVFEASRAHDMIHHGNSTRMSGADQNDLTGDAGKGGPEAVRFEYRERGADPPRKRGFGMASCAVAIFAVLVSITCPIVVLESFYPRLLFYTVTWTLGIALAIAGVVTSQRRLLAWVGLVVCVSGLAVSSVHFCRLYRDYRSRNWIPPLIGICEFTPPGMSAYPRAPSVSDGPTLLRPFRAFPLPHPCPYHVEPPTRECQHVS